MSSQHVPSVTEQNAGPLIRVFGLGPSTALELSVGLYQQLKEIDHLYVRTRRHPVVTELEEDLSLTSFDHIYEEEHDFQRVYERIVAHLIAEAQRQGTIAYAVPGHPLVAEQTVQMLLAEAKKGHVTVHIAGGHSFLDLLFTRLAIDPNDGCSILDGTALSLADLNPSFHLIITQVYDRAVASEVKLTLMELYPDEYQVTLVNQLGVTGEEQLLQLPLYELDRVAETSNLATVYVPPTQEDVVLNRWYHQSRALFKRLRGPDGCPWDRAQTHRSLRRYVLEEAEEVSLAIDRGDPDELLEELGDLLLQVFLHAQIAEEEGTFTMEDVLASLNAKLIRRHPHVFGDVKVESMEEVNRLWQQIKENEKKEDL